MDSSNRENASNQAGTASDSFTQAQQFAQLGHLRGRADAGDAHAMRDLASLMMGLAENYLSEGDEPQALEFLEGSRTWLERAAEAGDSGSMVSLGMLQRTTDKPSAVEWLTKAARLGHEHAFPALTQILDVGEVLEWVTRERQLGTRVAVEFWDNFRAQVEE